jgi:hypothetical protein
MASHYRRMPLAALPSLKSGAQVPLLFDIVSVQNWMRRRFPIYAAFAGCVEMDCNVFSKRRRMQFHYHFQGRILPFEMRNAMWISRTVIASFDRPCRPPPGMTVGD